MKIRPVEAETDGQTNVTMLIDVCSNFTNASKNGTLGNPSTEPVADPQRLSQTGKSQPHSTRCSQWGQ